MTSLRAIALSFVLAFGGSVVSAGYTSVPASATKMDGKATGRNVAHYGAPKAGTPKPPAKKGPAQHGEQARAFDSPPEQARRGTRPPHPEPRSFGCSAAASIVE